MNHDDDRLADLLRDAVSGVEPTDRLAEIRAATEGTPRRWWVAAGGAALATAAAVAVVAVVGGQQTAVDPGPANPGPSSTASGPTSAIPAYFVGESPTGPRLYREFQQVVSPTPGLSGLRLLESGPDDPDYTSEWPEGSFRAVSDPEAGVVHVALDDGAPAEPSQLALQQLAYTLDAGYAERLEVVVDRGDTAVARVTAAPQLEVLSLVSLSDPAEGQVVGDTLAVRGVASAFEATVPWRVERDGAVVDDGFFTAEGSMGTRLFPFSGEVDVSSLDPGSYTLIVETGDASGGTEGPGPYSDTRSFVHE